jgi:TATA-box binding protein (TBP) (component of TFIID and TFIIIB)
MKKVAAVATKAVGCTFLIFKTGKLMCMAAKTQEQADLAIAFLTSALQQILGLSELTVLSQTGCNLVFRKAFPYTIDLVKLYNWDRRLVRYNPEIFTGASLHKNGVTVVIFESGKTMFTGCADIDTNFETINWLSPILEQCKKCSNVSTSTSQSI